MHQCDSCERRRDRQNHEWCTYFAFSPKEPCTHNTFTPAAGQAMRMQFVRSLHERATQAAKQRGV